MAFPSSPTLDAFNRANGAIGSAWTTGVFGEVSTWSVDTNRAGASGAFNSTWWNAGTVGPDCEVYATLGVVPANGHLAYLGLRTQTPGSGAADCYEVVLVKNAGTDTINVYRVDNGAQTLLGAAFSQEVAAGDSIGLEAVGSTLTLYYKASGGSWTSLGTRTDATYSGAGYVFMGMQSTVGRWDDFGGGTVVAGSPFTLSGGPTLGRLSVAGSVTNTPPASVLSGGPTLARFSVAGTVVTTPPAVSLSGAVVLRGLSAAGTLTVLVPSTLSGAIVLSGLSVAGALNATIPAVSLTGAVVLRGLTIAGTVFQFVPAPPPVPVVWPSYGPGIGVVRTSGVALEGLQIVVSSGPSAGSSRVTATSYEPIGIAATPPVLAGTASRT